MTVTWPNVYGRLKSSLANEYDDAGSLLKSFLWHPGLFPAVVRWIVPIMIHALVLLVTTDQKTVKSDDYTSLVFEATCLSWDMSIYVWCARISCWYPYHWDFEICLVLAVSVFRTVWKSQVFVSKTKWPCASEKSCERWMHPFVRWVFSSHRSVDGQIFPWKVKVQVAFVVWSTLRLGRIARGVVLAPSTA